MLSRLTLLIPLLLLAFPAHAVSQVQKWEYGQLTVIGNIAFVWEAGDSSVLTQAPRDRDVGMPDKNAPKVLRQISGRMAQLNRIGEEGWELVSEQAGGDQFIYLFKRRKA